MVDYYGGTILILALASFEIIAFNWIYGTNFIGTFCYSFNTPQGLLIFSYREAFPKKELPKFGKLPKQGGGVK